MKKTIITLSLLVSFASASSVGQCLYYSKKALVSFDEVVLLAENNLTDNICINIDFALMDNISAVANCRSEKSMQDTLLRVNKQLMSGKETYCGGVK